MLTAAEARNLAGPTIEEKVQALLVTVEQLAKSGKRSLRTSYDHKKNADLWVQGGYTGSRDWEAACEILKKLGYKVSFFYEKRQLVDMYTVVEW